jgi:hypothetical protein
MTALTRRRNNEPHREGWRIFHGDIQVGTIARRAGVPLDAEQWSWTCGFYPGLEPGQTRAGSAPSYEAARSEFERAWRQLLPELAPESFETYRRHLAFERWKQCMWKEGFKMPTQLTGGRSQCFCGTPIDVASTEQHVYQAHMALATEDQFP